MTRNAFHPSATGDDANVAEYGAVSSLAVAGLIVGILGAVALVEEALWFVPLLAIVLSVLGLWRIARADAALVGRKAALAGLALGVLFGTAGPTDWFFGRWRVRSEARQFGELWFEFLRNGQPHKAYQLTMDPNNRVPLSDRLWDFYRGAPRWREELENYVAPAKPGEPAKLVRTLLALGPRAKVRYYQTPSQGHMGKRDIVFQIYAVTYEEAGKPQTFFVLLELHRLELGEGRANWRLLRAEGVSPENS